MDGFKNCPNIMVFKMGMRFHREDQYYEVLATTQEYAWAVRDREHIAIAHSCVVECILDMSSIWVGRCYREIDCVDHVILVQAVCNGYVGYRAIASSKSWCVPVEDFREVYEPVPAGDI